MGLIDERANIFKMAVSARILQQQAEGVYAADQFIRVADHDLYIQRLSTGFHHGDSLWMTIFSHDKGRGAVFLVHPL